VLDASRRTHVCRNDGLHFDRPVWGDSLTAKLKVHCYPRAQVQRSECPQCLAIAISLAPHFDMIDGGHREEAVLNALSIHVSDQ
jgi:hypothetical protein